MVLGVHEQEICAKSKQKRGVRYLFKHLHRPTGDNPMSVCGGTKELSVRLGADKLTPERYLAALFCLTADPFS